MLFWKSEKRPRAKKWVSIILLLVLVASLSGCKTVSFYAQAAKGQYQILAHQQRIDRLLAATNTPAELKNRLELLQQLRGFAASQLKLPVDGHYQKYVDLHRSYVVWNVEAAPELSMQPKTWWYPLVGSLEYRGYFTHRGATNYAAYLRRQGFDVAVGGVEAYSTLGWFKDPVLNTFLFQPDADLAEVVFHELGHQRVFAKGDTDFNEAFATTVGEEGARRWLRSKKDSSGLESYLSHLRRNQDFVHLVMETRARLEKLYGDVHDEDGKVRATQVKRSVPSEELRRAKQQIMADMKQRFGLLKTSWGGDTEFDSWFKFPVNNAHLNSVAAYYELVPGFEQLLAQNGGDLEKFYAAAERLSRLPKNERHVWLKEHAPAPAPAPAIARKPQAEALK